MALPPDAAIFSPSVARLAASTAKDWSYVDAWLASKYKGRSSPPFERNPDTLKILLALANLNEAADESRDLLAGVEAGALRGITAAAADAARRNDSEFPVDLSAFRSDFLAALEDALDKDGTAALDAMVAAAMRLGLALPDPAQLAQAQLALQTRASDMAQAVRRVEVLQRYVDTESARLDSLLAEVVDGDTYRPPADLARRNVEMQRGVRALAKALPEMKGQIVALARAVGVPDPTVEQVRREEDDYLELLEIKRSLDRQVADFEGLPPDTEQARQQLDGLRRELRSTADRRDAVFENLVERETPRKGR